MMQESRAITKNWMTWNYTKARCTCLSWGSACHRCSPHWTGIDWKPPHQYFDWINIMSLQTLWESVPCSCGCGQSLLTISSFVNPCHAMGRICLGVVFPASCLPPNRSCTYKKYFPHPLVSVWDNQIIHDCDMLIWRPCIGFVVVVIRGQIIFNVEACGSSRQWSINRDVKIFVSPMLVDIV